MAGIGLANVVQRLQRRGFVSTGKTFASLAILQLVEEGKLSLDDSVKELAPEVWFENRWEESDPIRTVHLLEYTTGWDDLHFREYAKNDLKTRVWGRLLL